MDLIGRRHPIRLHLVTRAQYVDQWRVSIVPFSTRHVLKLLNRWSSSGIFEKRTESLASLASLASRRPLDYLSRAVGLLNCFKDSAVRFSLLFKKGLGCLACRASLASLSFCFASESPLPSRTDVDSSAAFFRGFTMFGIPIIPGIRGIRGIPEFLFCFRVPSSFSHRR